MEDPQAQEIRELLASNNIKVRRPFVDLRELVEGICDASHGLKRRMVADRQVYNAGRRLVMGPLDTKFEDENPKAETSPRLRAIQFVRGVRDAVREKSPADASLSYVEGYIMGRRYAPPEWMYDESLRAVYFFKS